MSEDNTTLVIIDASSIAANVDNPRRLFDKDDLKYLRESIKEFGILVPLIVYKEDTGGRKYTLLDGERRLRCARDLELTKIPANIIDRPNRLHNILTMFNIHNVRKDWEMVPTALKLETILRLLKKENISNIRLAKLTGMSAIRVAECRRILTFERKYIDMALELDTNKRIRGDFFSQLALPLAQIKNFPEIVDKYGKDKFIDKMIEKYREGTIVNHINEFRMLKKVLISTEKGVSKKTILISLKKFLESKPITDDDGIVKEKAMTIKDLFEETSGEIYREETMIKKSNGLTQTLNALDVKKARKSSNLTNALKDLSKSINKVLGKV